MRSPLARWALGVAVSVLLFVGLRLMLIRDQAPRPEPAGPPPPPIEAPAAPSPTLEHEPVDQTEAPVDEPLEEEAPREEPPPPMARIRACDLADGRAVPNLLLGVPGREESFRTGAAGEIEVEVSIGMKVRPVDEGWRAVGVPVTVEDEALVLWMYRELDLTGLVTGKSEVKELDHARVELSLVGVGEERTAVPGRPELTRDWFAGHHLGLRRKLAEVKADGSFRARVPRLPGLVVIAQARGWESARVPVDWKSDPSFLRLELTKPSLRIQGKLVDEDGSPLAKRGITAFVTLRMTAGEYDRFRAETRGHGYTSAVNRKKDYAILTFSTGSMTDADGSFSIESKVRGGELLLLSRPVGNQDLVLLRLGSLVDDMTAVELVARMCNRPQVRVMKHGVPQRNRKLTLAIRSMDEQPAFDVQLDDQGCMSGAYLLEGQDYTILDSRNSMIRWYLRWHGGASLELTDLATRYQDRPR